MTALTQKLSSLKRASVYLKIFALVISPFIPLMLMLTLPGIERSAGSLAFGSICYVVAVLVTMFAWGTEKKTLKDFLR